MCFLFVMLSNYRVCENGSAIKQCSFQNSYHATARVGFLVVHMHCISKKRDYIFGDKLN